MERRTKLAGRPLALCCVFAVFTCVSSVGFYNPDLYIKRITELLVELHRDLAHTECKLPRNRNKNDRFSLWRDLKSKAPEISHLPLKNVGAQQVNGVRWLDMERGKPCPGTILDIFQHGTKNILKLNFSPSVHDITEDIDHCVTKLWGECKILQKHEPNCNYSPHREKVIDFVSRFRSFSKLLRLWNTCSSTSNQEGDLSEDIENRPGETTSICGKH